MLKLKTYYDLTKPGIIYGNIITTAAGFFLASRLVGYTNFCVLAAVIFGISLVIAAGCIVNNYIDRDIDANMERTKNRAFVLGKVSVRNAFILAFILAVIGFKILALYTNLLTVCVAAAGVFIYLVLYTQLKRTSVYSTIVGSFSGAVPIVAGYTAVTNNFDAGAWILLAILCLWQIPHFYSIAIYRLDDYKNAGLPILPVKKGILTTKIHITLYICAFIIALFMLVVYGYAGYLYAAVAAILGALWLGLSLKGFKKNVNEKKWARKMFLFSLVVLVGICSAIAVKI